MVVVVDSPGVAAGDSAAGAAGATTTGGAAGAAGASSFLVQAAADNKSAEIKIAFFMVKPFLKDVFLNVNLFDPFRSIIKKNAQQHKILTRPKVKADQKNFETSSACAFGLTNFDFAKRFFQFHLKFLKLVTLKKFADKVAARSQM